MKTQKSCVNCNRRKQRCDLKSPCSHCLKRKVECSYVAKTSEPIVKEIAVKAKDETYERIKRKHEKLEELFEVYNSHKFSSSPESLNLIILPEIREPSSPSLASSPELQLDLQKLSISSTESTLEFRLMRIYFTYHHRIHPFMDEERVLQLWDSQKLGAKFLVNSICAFTLPLFLYLLSKPIMKIDDNPFYKQARYYSKKCSLNPDLNSVQALILLLTFEMGNALPVRASLTLTEVIRLGQVLRINEIGFDNNVYNLTPLEKEQHKTWLVCMAVDLLNSMFFDNPFIVRHEDYPIAQPLGYKFNPDRILSKQELLHCEVTLLRTFCYLARIKAKWNKVNIQLLNRELGFESLKIYLKELTNLTYDLDVQESITDARILSQSIIDPSIHPLYLSCWNIYGFKLALLSLVKFLISTTLGLGDKEHINQSCAYLALSKQLILENYRLSEAIESRFESVLGTGMSAVFFATHFCHVFTFEWTKIPYANCQTKEEKDLLETLNSKIDKGSAFWPIALDPTCRRRAVLPASVDP